MSIMATQLAGRGEQSRARYPDEDGYVERGGVRVYYEVYGQGEPTLFLLPAWSIVHSRVWKMQIPYLARHFRVITFDGRGNGRSDRPTEVEAYLESEFAADALAVLDRTETDRAVLVSLSRGALWGTLLAAEHPERVAGIAYIAPAMSIDPDNPERVLVSSVTQPEPFEKPPWEDDYEAFLQWFFAHMFNEPH